MFHVYEGPSTLPGDRFVVISDEDWGTLPTDEQVRYQQRQGGFRTALDAVIHMLDASDRGRVIAGDSGQVAERSKPVFSEQDMPFHSFGRASTPIVITQAVY